MFDTFQNRLVITGTLVTQTGFRIGTGRSTEPVGTDLPLIKDALGQPFIPGSSLKGVLRSEAERILRAILPNGQGACLPTASEEERCISNTEMNRLRQQHQANDRKLAQVVRDKSCLACQTFGSPWLASHVQVRDALVDKTNWFGQFQVRDGVAIDRDKGTAAANQLYNYETVPAGSRFECHIICENGQPWQWGLLWLALRLFVDGNGALGGFTSRGLGWIQLMDYTLRLTEASADPVTLVDNLLGKGTVVEETQRQKWIDALKARLHQLSKEGQDAQTTTE